MMSCFGKEFQKYHYKCTGCPIKNSCRRQCAAVLKKKNDRIKLRNKRKKLVIGQHTQLLCHERNGNETQKRNPIHIVFESDIKRQSRTRI